MKRAAHKAALWAFIKITSPKRTSRRSRSGYLSLTSNLLFDHGLFVLSFRKRKRILEFSVIKTQKQMKYQIYFRNVDYAS